MSEKCTSGAGKTARELAQKLDELDRRVSKHDNAIAEIIEAICQCMPPVRKITFLYHNISQRL